MSSKGQNLGISDTYGISECGCIFRQGEYLGMDVAKVLRHGGNICLLQNYLGMGNYMVTEGNLGK